MGREAPQPAQSEAELPEGDGEQVPAGGGAGGGDHSVKEGPSQLTTDPPAGRRVAVPGPAFLV